MNLEKLGLQGKTNIYGSTAARVYEKLIHIRKNNILKSFENSYSHEHRLEHIANIHGIEFINDAKAINENATWWALESIKNPIIWIVGGDDDKIDYNKFSDSVKNKVKAIICLGNDNKKIYKAFADEVEHISETMNMNKAVEKAYLMGKKGDVVLLSPACDSLNIYKDYIDRGNHFRNAVRSL